jgi:hypothetical protein
VAQIVSRPLRKLIEFAQVINDTTMGLESQKTDIMTVHDLPQGVFQVQELIDGFKHLMGEIDLRFHDKKKENSLITSMDKFPYNDLDENYLKRTGRKCNIDWPQLISKIPKKDPMMADERSS